MSEQFRCHCCPQPVQETEMPRLAMSRRGFLSGMTAGGALLSGLTWSALAAETSEAELLMPPKRKPLVVLPALIHDLPQRREMTSWRNWGGVDSLEAAKEETARIAGELAGIKSNADFPVEILPAISCTDASQLLGRDDVAAADVVIAYGAGGGIDGVQHLGKDVIIFQRWTSGPVYLQYEIVSPRFLRQHTDSLALTNIAFDDVVTDSLDELTWRLRALCGLKNARNTRIVTIGAPDCWAQSRENVDLLMERLKQQWGLDVQCVSYPELETLIAEANKDAALNALAEKRAAAYLAAKGVTLETNREYVVNCFKLDQVFRAIMKKADSYAITVLSCMGTIMPLAKTSACLTLSLLNDDGYLAFCESDFAVIPSGIILAHISGKPVFLNDPTYPHDSIITLAHCTSPRKMDGVHLDPVRLVTHFESDFGAAPKVDMQLGMVNTNIAPDFKSERWVGLRGEIIDNPFRPICRSQIDIRYTCPDSVVAERMPGFHWMFCYGDYMKEVGYALRRVGIKWEDLDNA